MGGELQALWDVATEFGSTLVVIVSGVPTERNILLSDADGKVTFRNDDNAGTRDNADCARG